MNFRIIGTMHTNFLPHPSAALRFRCVDNKKDTNASTANKVPKCAFCSTDSWSATMLPINVPKAIPKCKAEFFVQALLYIRCLGRQLNQVTLDRRCNRPTQHTPNHQDKPEEHQWGIWHGQQTDTQKYDHCQQCALDAEPVSRKSSYWSLFFFVFLEKNAQKKPSFCIHHNTITERDDFFAYPNGYFPRV